MYILFRIGKVILRLGIGSADIASGNLKLILGLIWTLILKYQISVGFAISDPSAPKVEGPSPKQALLSYVQVSPAHSTLREGRNVFHIKTRTKEIEWYMIEDSNWVPGVGCDQFALRSKRAAISNLLKRTI